MKTLIVSGARGTDRQTMSPIELLWTANKEKAGTFKKEEEKRWHVKKIKKKLAR